MSPSDGDEELTRKQRREEAREQRRALEQAEVAGAARRRRLQLLGGVLVIVVVVIVVVLVSSGGKSGGLAKGKEKTAVTREIAKLLGGIPQSGNALGKATAPVTLQYFGDLECPVCRAFTLETLPAVINKWVRAGDLRIEYQSLETATREPETFKKQQEAAYAAGAQNKAWYFIETFYHEQGAEDSGYVTENYIDGIAKQVPGLDLTQWQTARGNPKFLAKVEEDAQTANSESLEATPAFLISRKGEVPQKLGAGLLPESHFNESIEALLKG